jgi:hypothetical protein
MRAPGKERVSPFITRREGGGGREGWCLEVLRRHNGAHSVHQAEIFTLDCSEPAVDVTLSHWRMRCERRRAPTAPPPASAACGPLCTGSYFSEYNAELQMRAMPGVPEKLGLHARVSGVLDRCESSDADLRENN